MNQSFMKEIEQEYREFLQIDRSTPAQNLSERIHAQIFRDLNPSAWNIFAKLSLIHLVIGLTTLALCPQFGVRTLGSGLGIAKYFLFLGSYGCIAACGAFFLGATLLIAALVLRPEDVRVLRRHEFLQMSVVAMLSLGGFVMFEAEILFGFALAWFVGSILGGMAMLEAGWFLRRRVLALS